MARKKSSIPAWIGEANKPLVEAGKKLMARKRLEAGAKAKETAKPPKRYTSRIGFCGTGV